MYDAHDELIFFHDNHVRVPQDEREQLRNYRNLNIQRLKDGLDELASARGTTYRYPRRERNQGSYATHCLVQPHPDNGEEDYDIDIALIFGEGDLPESALQARKRIAAAFNELDISFNDDPEPRTNAVTIWYADGYHVDFAVYREFQGSGLTSSSTIEHAGADWTERDPMALTNWLFDQIRLQSPARNEAEVRENQLRRIIRLLKYFARSRTSWKLPGGIVLSTLAANHFVPDTSRDDAAFRKTLQQIHSRLRDTTDVANPVNSHQSLTGSDEHRSEVRRLRSKIRSALEKLTSLDSPKTDRADAMTTWGKVFNSEWWSDQTEGTKLAESIAGSREDSWQEIGHSVDINATLYKDQGGFRLGAYASGQEPLNKGLSIFFEIENTTVPRPFEVRWVVENTGREACLENDDPGHVKEGNGETVWERTKYSGTHFMHCRIVKDGRIAAQDSYVVKVR